MNELTPVPTSEYNAELINELLIEEISAFVDHLSEATLSHQQELRGGLIAWLCYFLSEMVSPSIRKLLLNSYEDNRTSYFETWYQLLPLEMAMFGLSRDEAWLNNHKRNLAYGGSMLRYYVMQSLALAVPDLYFDDPQMYDAIRYGLSIPYFEAEMGAAMLAMCKGDSGHKKKTLAEWHGAYFLNRPEILKNLSEGTFAENWFFMWPFFRTQTYILHRLCQRRQSSSLKSSPGFLFVGSLVEQVEKHPLMQALIRIHDKEKDQP